MTDMVARLRQLEADIRGHEWADLPEMYLLALQAPDDIRQIRRMREVCNALPLLLDIVEAARTVQQRHGWANLVPGGTYHEAMEALAAVLAALDSRTAV